MVEKSLWSGIFQLAQRRSQFLSRFYSKKAIEFYRRLKILPNILLPDGFKASSGWIARFKSRFNIYLKNERGESASVDLNLVESARLEIKDCLPYYHIDDIYNNDELGIFTSLGPSTTLASKSDVAKVFKKDKMRVNVLLTSNAPGTKKLKPLLINKVDNPRCLKNISIKILSVKYHFNKSALMTGEIWLKFLKWFDIRKYFLLLNNSQLFAKK